jgi:ArsR family transcriptional regulator
LKLLDCCGSTPCCATSRDEASAVVGELGEDLMIVASTFSHHFKELKRAGLIHLERQCKNVSCWVNPDALGELKEFFDRY